MESNTVPPSCLSPPCSTLDRFSGNDKAPLYLDDQYLSTTAKTLVYIASITYEDKFDSVDGLDVIPIVKNSGYDKLRRYENGSYPFSRPLVIVVHTSIKVALKCLI